MSTHGPGNTGMNYDMGGTILSKIVKEKDLGVTLNAYMTVSEQYRIAVSKQQNELPLLSPGLGYDSTALGNKVR